MLFTIRDKKSLFDDGRNEILVYMTSPCFNVLPFCRVCRKARTESIAQVYEQIAFAIKKERTNFTMYI